MKFTLESIARRLPELLDAAHLEILPLQNVRISPTEAPPGEVTPARLASWREVRPGDRWGGPGITRTFALPIEVPPGWTGSLTSLSVTLGEYADLTGPEGLLFLDGRPLQGIDRYHREVRLDGILPPGKPATLLLEAYSSLLPTPQTLGPLQLSLIDGETLALYHDLRTLHGAVLAMDTDSVPRVRLLHALEGAHRCIDLRRPRSDDFLRSVREARALLRREIWEAPSEGPEPRVVAVGHAHIDLAWLWPVSQTRRKGVRTFSTALHLMDRYPHYHFVASQPALYRMVQEQEPGMYSRVLERVGEGRWEPTGATWVEMDCNLTGSEALVRQFLVGKHAFREDLGVDPTVLWLPDAFGYSAALPQIMAGCGVPYFMTTKISWNEYNRIPHDTFRWRGIDGTEVLAHMVTAPVDPADDPHSLSLYTYNAKLTPSDVAGTWSAYREKGLNGELLYLYGYGDGGGGPTAEMQETAERLRALPGFPRLEQRSAEGFFRDLAGRVWDNPDLPTWAGELYLEYHRGTYTSQGWIKRANRLAELLYREAELWSAFAGAASADGPDATTALRAGWEALLFNQFHDILPGSSIGQVYVDARRDYERIATVGEEVRDTGLAALTRGIAGEPGDLVVFNPAPFPREDTVELDLPREGERLPNGPELQEIDVGRVLVAASAPALGYRTYGERDRRSRGAGAVEVGERVLENAFFRVELDERGQIASLLDKRIGREVIAPGERGNRLVAFEDRPLDFDAWDIQFGYEDKPYPVDDLRELRVVERGPLRGGVEIVRRYGESTIRQRVLLHRDVPRIDFPTRVDWHEHQTLLKVAFPVTVNNPRATFDIQWGNVERPTHRNTSWDWARFETCAHKWADLSEGDYGVSLLNDCKYGHDIHGHTIRLTLIKSGIYPDPEADQGVHTFSYALLPHPGDWRTGGTVRHAYLFNMPARAALLPGGSGPLPPELSLVRTDRPGLVIETVKPAEGGDGLIVRAYDAHNTRGPATLTFCRDVLAAQIVNLLEEAEGEAEWEGKDVRFIVRPYGIHSFRIRLR